MPMMKHFFKYPASEYSAKSRFMLFARVLMRKRKKAIENHDYPGLGGISHRETQRGVVNAK